MLVSLLPGLRDLRTPLATGYLWLLGLWLLFHNHVPSNVHEATGPTEAIYKLGALIGTGGCLAAASFAAYVVGSILALKPRRNYVEIVAGRRSFLRNPALILTVFASMIFGGTLGLAVISSLGSSSRRGNRRQIETYVERRLREANRLIDGFAMLEVLPEEAFDVENMSAAESDELAGELQQYPIPTLTKQYVTSVISELDAVGTQLQVKNRDLWDSYDRQNSEAQFRYGISPPLALVIVIFAIQSGQYLWLLLLVVPTILIILARQLSDSTASILVQAIVLNMVQPPVIERLSEAVARKREENESGLKFDLSAIPKMTEAKMEIVPNQSEEPPID